jgi:L-alanine-DL-glutamate epimerase-like enolase superfamily enzyme
MYFGWYQELVDQPPPLTHGTITVPPGPGLGCRLQPGLERRGDAIRRWSRP